MSKSKLNRKSESKDLQGELQGEGNYTAAKEYDDATRSFIKKGKVDEAARNAAPKNDREAREMLEAEEKGRAHAKSNTKKTDIRGA